MVILVLVKRKTTQSFINGDRFQTERIFNLAITVILGGSVPSARMS